MNSTSNQNSVDGRNRVFAISVLVVIVILLTILIEKKILIIKPQTFSVQSTNVQKKRDVLVKTPVTQKTTVEVRPLIIEFPPLPDFSSFNQVDKRKAAFIDYLTPIISYQNEKVLQDRARLEKISILIVNGISLSADDRKWVQQLARKYDVKWEEKEHGAVVIKLARRVDIIPISLALVQAAKESSWGRSRYAVQANNLFGQWCFDAGCGVIPEDRPPDAIHEVKRFSTVNDATRSYIHNLNTHPKYETLRKIRQYLRIYHKEITGEALAEGLLYYSERRQAYIDEVKIMIEQYRYFQERRTG